MYPKCETSLELYQFPSFQLSNTFVSNSQNSMTSNHLCTSRSRAASTGRPTHSSPQLLPPIPIGEFQGHRPARRYNPTTRFVLGLPLVCFQDGHAQNTSPGIRCPNYSPWLLSTLRSSGSTLSSSQMSVLFSLCLWLTFCPQNILVTCM